MPSLNANLTNLIRSFLFFFPRVMPSFAHAMYFWFSLFFLLFRTMALSLYAAAIHDESKKPIEVLRAVPHYSWCMEVRRFSEEVVNNTVALTGMRFFYLTRKLILSVGFKKITKRLSLLFIAFHFRWPEQL